MPSFVAYCPHCEKKVTASTVLAGSNLKAALDSNGEVGVVHLADGGDHQWNLVSNEKENLRNQIAAGTLKLMAVPTAIFLLGTLIGKCEPKHIEPRAPVPEPVTMLEAGIISTFTGTASSIILPKINQRGPH